MSATTLGLACLFAPLVGFFIAFVGFRKQPALAAAVVLTSGLVAAASSVLLLAGGAPDQPLHTWSWFTIGHRSIDFGLLLDGRTLIMGAVVGVITLCIQVYSLGYMAHDKGRARFFAFLSLFEWAMLSFVYAPSLLQTFIFWELVGLASFLLIGFWYEKPSAVAAAKKAFLMTRIGDIGLFIGLILLFQTMGSLDILAVNHAFAAPGLPAGVSDGRVELIAALLFAGIVGKSAQFPLHTWLPDAMEGPTPVSALLHSATMVAAGVFLFARFHELFGDAETVMTVALSIAAFTAVLASTMALVARDMKRVLAYSSISQLGFMLIGLAAGNLFAGVFHLTTHALFKALLFMTAGSYIHTFGTNDMIAIGREGGRKMKVTTLALVVGGAALAGLPPLAGFFSKETIIGSLDGRSPIFLGLAYLATFMTAYYTFRMIFFVLRPNGSSAAVPAEPAWSQHAHDSHDAHDEHGEHGHAVHESPWVMLAPMMLLAAGAVVAGFFGDALGDLLRLSVHHPSIGAMAPAIGVALFGVAMAWLDFGRSGAAQTGFIARVPALQRLFENGWYLDAIYRAVFVKPALALARGLYAVETKGFDVGADQIARGTGGLGGRVARTQSARLPITVGSAMVVLAAVASYLGLR